ncbi:MAG TPA: asparagine synthase (glutamine-hydrolyzing) [Lacibacter sp.]|nr:asparagine synthase (glutamine-hydrolyzing) [Lacibacter sp.]HMO88453.1 asparagine synthase (glutamine-hydrolyzing) [Lacibacter sp.]HMP86634.1 asparagine synthase (glutamine-hydrolyzing) [Lacibacter sp.]
MCGISGVLSPNPSLVTPDRLGQMTNALAHRGPDGEGHWINTGGTTGLGHRRLSVVDLSPEAGQPFHYLGRYTLVYNGELYNHPELREELQQQGFSFRTRSDTEVLAAAYACWGADCLQRFDGMFAFALWDEQEQLLFAARDRFGEKPFYYFYDGEQLLFASECKALWAAGVLKSWNHLLLLSYLANGHTQNAVDASLTFYKDVYAIPPGHYASFHLPRRELLVNLYWDLDKQQQQAIPEQEAVEQFRHLFRTSVQRRLRSDVPVGTSLSGGLDSSSIVATICEQLQAASGSWKATAFTATFPGFEKDESSYAAEVAAQLQLQHHTVTPSLEGFFADFERLCHHQEQPFGSASVYAQYKVMELAKENGVTVLLDGQGADETLAGYTRYVHWYLQELVGRFRYGFAMQERIRLQQNSIPFEWGLPNYLAALFPVVANAHLEEVERKKILVHPHLRHDYAAEHYDKFYSIYKPPVSRLNDILYFTTMQQGLGELLHYADRNSMAHGRELRLPFLSHELVEFVFSLPAWYKIRDGFPKWLLRQAMDGKLSDRIVWRTDKVGYEPPQRQWMEHPALRERIHESRKRLVDAQILDASVLERPIRARGSYEADNYDWRYLCVAQMM